MDKLSRSQGQSLIETIVAIFILTMGLSAAVGVGIFALSTTTVNLNEAVANNLAREGLEAVRIMRDSNWLAQHAQLTTCAGVMNNKPCYPNAFSNLVPILSPSTDFIHYRPKFNLDTRTWTMDTANGKENYYMCTDSSGFFYTNVNGEADQCNSSVAKFARRVMITRGSTSNGFSVQYPEYRVQSIVAWTGKNCPSIVEAGNTLYSGSATTPGRCKVIVEDRLTNWKDYK